MRGGGGSRWGGGGGQAKIPDKEGDKGLKMRRKQDRVEFHALSKAVELLNCFTRFRGATVARSA
jgi:hypothetical protein